MSTAAMDRTHSPAGAFARIWPVVKLNLTNPWTTIVLPWIILGVIFAANLVIWALISRAASPADRAEVAEGFSYGGSALYIFVYMLVVAVQAISFTFPFALGYGVTRRDFYLGTALTFVLLSAMYAVGLGILAVIEEATDGWGLNGRMFAAAYFGDGGWLARMWIMFVAFLFFFFVGSVCAAIYLRYRSNGIVAFFIGLGALLIGVAALFTYTESWNQVGEFFTRWGFLGSYTWSLLLTAVAGVTGFLILRRATPKA